MHIIPNTANYIYLKRLKYVLVQGKSMQGLLVASNGFNEAIVYISIALTGKR